MFCITMNLTSDEWMRIKQRADKQWPQERLTCAEIMRRYILAGMEALKNLSPDEQARMAHQFQASMTAKSDTRLRV